MKTKEIRENVFDTFDTIDTEGLRRRHRDQLHPRQRAQRSTDPSVYNQVTEITNRIKTAPVCTQA